MNPEDQAKALADWLAAPPGTAPPDGVDRDVLEAVFVLRPDLAPPPELEGDDLEAALSGGLEAWLHGEGSPDEVDPEVAGAVAALRPDLAPPPAVGIEQILARVDDGPLAAPAEGAEVVPFPSRGAPPVEPPAHGEAPPGERAQGRSRASLRRAWPLAATLLAAVLVGVVLVPRQDRLGQVLPDEVAVALPPPAERAPVMTPPVEPEAEPEPPVASTPTLDQAPSSPSASQGRQATRPPTARPRPAAAPPPATAPQPAAAPRPPPEPAPDAEPEAIADLELMPQQRVARRMQAFEPEPFLAEVEEVAAELPGGQATLGGEGGDLATLGSTEADTLRSAQGAGGGVAQQAPAVAADEPDAQLVEPALAAEPARGGPRGYRAERRAEARARAGSANIHFAEELAEAEDEDAPLQDGRFGAEMDELQVAPPADPATVSRDTGAAERGALTLQLRQQAWAIPVRPPDPSRLDADLAARIAETEQLAARYTAAGRPADAARALQPLLDAPAPVAHWYAGEVSRLLLEAGDVEGALRVGERALGVPGLHPQTQHLHRAQGDALWRAGRPDEAQRHWQRAVSPP